MGRLTRQREGGLQLCPETGRVSPWKQAHVDETGEGVPSHSSSAVGGKLRLGPAVNQKSLRTRVSGYNQRKNTPSTKKKKKLICMCRSYIK